MIAVAETVFVLPVDQTFAYLKRDIRSWNQTCQRVLWDTYEKLFAGCLMVELLRFGHRGDLFYVGLLVLVDLLILRNGCRWGLGRTTGAAGDLLFNAFNGLDGDSKRKTSAWWKINLKVLNTSCVYIWNQSAKHSFIVSYTFSTRSSNGRTADELPCHNPCSTACRQVREQESGKISTSSGAQQNNHHGWGALTMMMMIIIIGRSPRVKCALVLAEVVVLSALQEDVCPTGVACMISPCRTDGIRRIWKGFILKFATHTPCSGWLLGQWVTGDRSSHRSDASANEWQENAWR